jgi:hypothetical protein
MLDTRTLLHCVDQDQPRAGKRFRDRQQFADILAQRKHPDACFGIFLREHDVRYIEDSLDICAARVEPGADRVFR